MKKLFVTLATAVSLFTGHAFGMDFICVEPGDIKYIAVRSTEQQKKICASRPRLGALFVIYKLYKNGNQSAMIANCERDQIEYTSACLSDKLNKELPKGKIDQHRAYRFCQSSTQNLEGTQRNKIGTLEICLTPGHVEPTFSFDKVFFEETEQ